jgi:hypothetical protein
MTTGGARPCWLTAGLLHVLAGHPSTGGAAGSRAEEAQNFWPRAQGPAALLEVLRRALDAAVEPVTLAAGREGARPPHEAAA